MKIFAEIYPSKHLVQFKERIKKMDNFDGFNIPDNPLGYPTVPPDLIACIIRSVFPDREIIINQRLKDINELKLRSEIHAALALNASMIFTQGDTPKFGKEVNHITSENAIFIAKKRKLKSGLILSFNRPAEDIKKRMELPADLFLVININKLSMLDNVDTKRLMPYIIVKTDRNYDILKRIKQSAIDLKDLKNYIRDLSKYGLYGILLSVPGDNEVMENIFEYI